MLQSVFDVCMHGVCVACVGEHASDGRDGVLAYPGYQSCAGLSRTKMDKVRWTRVRPQGWARQEEGSLRGGRAGQRGKVRGGRDRLDGERQA